LVSETSLRTSEISLVNFVSNPSIYIQISENYSKLNILGSRPLKPQVFVHCGHKTCKLNVMISKKKDSSQLGFFSNYTALNQKHPLYVLAQRFRNHPKKRKKALKTDRKVKVIAGRLVMELERKLPAGMYESELTLFQ